MAQAGVKGIKEWRESAIQGGTAGLPVPLGMGSPAFFHNKKQSRNGNARKKVWTHAHAARISSLPRELKSRDGTVKQSRKGNARKKVWTHAFAARISFLKGS